MEFYSVVLWFALTRVIDKRKRRYSRLSRSGKNLSNLRFLMSIDRADQRTNEETPAPWQANLVERVSCLRVCVFLAAKNRPREHAAAACGRLTFTRPSLLTAARRMSRFLNHALASPNPKSPPICSITSSPTVFRPSSCRRRARTHAWASEVGLAHQGVQRGAGSMATAARSSTSDGDCDAQG